MDRPATLSDVARLAGVATSTVSRTFSRPGRVKAETAERIRQAAADVGYRVNPLHGALAAAQTHTIALIVPDITNPFYFEIIRGAEATAAEAGYTMVLADTEESQRLERLALERTISGVEGILLASTRMSDSAIVTYAKQKPMLVLNRHVVGVPSVITDNPRGARLAAEHLVGLGHERVTYVAGPEASWADGSRWTALRLAAADLGLRARRVGPFAPTLEGGMYAAADFVDSGATAAICYNDILAIGLTRGLSRARMRVPGQVSVIGFDNTMVADLVEPGLTTVAAPLRAMGATAAQYLLGHLHGSSSLHGEPYVLPTRLIVRGSTAAAPASVHPVGRGPTDVRAQALLPPPRHPFPSDPRFAQHGQHPTAN